MQERDANDGDREVELRRRPTGDSAHLRHAGAGLQFALTFLALGLVGWWLDRRVGTAPWLLIGGIVLGAAGGMYSLAARLGGLPAPKQPGSEQPRRPPDLR